MYSFFSESSSSPRTRRDRPGGSRVQCSSASRSATRPRPGTTSSGSSSASGSSAKRRSCRRGCGTVSPGSSTARRRRGAGRGRSSAAPSARRARGRARARPRAGLEQLARRELGLDRGRAVQEARLVGDADGVGLAQRRDRDDAGRRRAIARAGSSPRGRRGSRRARRRRRSRSRRADGGVLDRRVEHDLRLAHAHRHALDREARTAARPRAQSRAPRAGGTRGRPRPRARRRRPRGSRRRPRAGRSCRPRPPRARRRRGSAGPARAPSPARRAAVQLDPVRARSITRSLPAAASSASTCSRTSWTRKIDAPRS